MTFSPAPRLPALLSFVVLALLGALVFGPPALHAQHLNFDDPFFFGAQSAFASGGLAQVLDPRQTIANVYLPVAHLSLYVDWLLGGSDAAWVPRLHSALLHVVVAFLLARLLGRLGLSVAAATAAAALFSLHPALVESVAWSSSRKDVLSGLGVIACLSACVAHAHAPSGRRLVTVGLWALFALYSKATAIVVAPLAALLVLGSARQPGAWRAVLLLFAVVLLGGLHHSALAVREGTLAGALDAGLSDRLLRAPGAYLHYLGKLIWPTSLNVLYPEVITLEAFAARVGWASVVLAALTSLALGALLRPRTRVAGVATCAVLIALLPFNTALPASTSAAADRYLYLVVPWAALAIAALAGRAATLTCGGLAVVAAVLTIARVDAFADSQTLWRQSLAQDPRNAVACLNLAITPAVAGDRTQTRLLLEQATQWARYPHHKLRAEAALASVAWQEERREAAVRHARQALDAARALPDSEAARLERVRRSLQGAVMAQTAGDGEAAQQLAVDALTLAPEHAAVLSYRASSLLRVSLADGRLRDDAAAARVEAFAMLDRAVQTDPDAADPHVVRAQWLGASGDNLAALKSFDDALLRAPLHSDAHAGKVDLLLAQGLFGAAEAAARRAIAARLDDAPMLAKLGMALAGQRKLADARAFYEDSLRLRPTDSGVRRLLAAVLVLETRPLLFQLPGEQLEARADKIRELEPTNPEASLILAMARRHQRRLRDALVLLEGARQTLPDDPDVVRLLADTHRDLGYQLMLQGGERDRSIDHLREFCALAPSDVPTEGARMVIEQEATRQEDAGVKAFGKQQLVEAQAHFRRCLALMPDRAYTRYQLGLTLLQRGGDSAAEALDLFLAAETGLRAQGHDAGLPVLYQIMAMRRLGQDEAAAAKARAFVAVTANASSPAFDRIRELAR